MKMVSCLILRACRLYVCVEQEQSCASSLLWVTLHAGWTDDDDEHVNKADPWHWQHSSSSSHHNVHAYRGSQISYCTVLQQCIQLDRVNALLPEAESQEDH